MAAVAAVDAWLETCLITISFIGGDELEFAGLTDTIDFNFGEKDIDPIALCNGGRVTKWVPEGPTEITMELYPTEAGTSITVAGSGTGIFDFLHPLANVHSASPPTQRDEVVPIRITNSRFRSRARVLFLWTTDDRTSAVEATDANERALRIGAAEGYIISVKASFTDGILKFTAKFKCAAFTKNGASNTMIESAAGFDVNDKLPVIAAYTTSNVFG